MKLIDKDKIIAEIEGRIEAHKETLKNCDSSISEMVLKGSMSAYQNLLHFFNTLEVKEVDLEKEYEEYVVDDPIWGNFITNDTMGMELAKHFFELGLKVSQKKNEL